jgi:hypothetical protein
VRTEKLFTRLIYLIAESSSSFENSLDQLLEKEDANARKEQHCQQGQFFITIQTKKLKRTKN